MNTEKKDFDKEAASFDELPRRVKLAMDIALAISNQIALTHNMNVMDFGCGTGLLTVELQPLVHSIVGVDSSRGMLDVFKTKITELKLNNASAVLIDPDRNDTLAGDYDLVVSNMTLHHIKEIEPLFEQFYNIIAPGGRLCIADLDLDDGRFHDDKTGVFHFGFERATLRRIFTQTGFENVQDITAAEVERQTDNGKIRQFTVFLMVGRKGSDGAGSGM